MLESEERPRKKEESREKRKLPGPETSLERGMREIKETAKNLEQNIEFFRSNRNSKQENQNSYGQMTSGRLNPSSSRDAIRDSLAYGFGSSFRPQPNK
jgi:hypothetical protein